MMHETLNGRNGLSVAKVSKPPSTGAKKRTATSVATTNRKALVARAPRLALWLTVTMGVAIPLLSLALTTVAGTLARKDHPWLALGGLTLCATVLGVSLSHLSWSVSDITKSGKAASWALAVATDLTIVLCESVHVFASDAGIDCLVTAMMVSVTLASMALNVWAFLRHR